MPDTGLKDDVNAPTASTQPAGWIRKLVTAGNTRCCKIAIISLWTGLSIGGIAAMPSFMAALKSSIPPVHGTDAKAASDAMDKYFYGPLGGEKPSEVAMLASNARNGVPLMNCSHDADYSTVLATTNMDWMNVFAQPADAGFQQDKVGNTTVYTFRPGSLSAITNITCERCASTCNSKPSSFYLSNTQINLYIPPFMNAALLLNLVNVTHHSLGKDKGPMVASYLYQELYLPLRSSVLTPDCVNSLTAVSLVGCDDKTERKVAEQFHDLTAVGLSMTTTSMQLMSKNIQEGVDATMTLSTLTLPLALLVLALMLSNVRLVICTVLNVGAAISCSFLLMLPIAELVDVTSSAPSMMIAVALAMSIDYSLFLLSRFQSEIPKDLNTLTDEVSERAVGVMLSTSGRIVLVSGGTLLLCFMMMLVIPVSLISMMGVAAAVTVLFTILVALTLTPTLLLCFPNFFTSSRRFGFSMDGLCCGQSDPDQISELSYTSLTADTTDHQPSSADPQTCWSRVGSLTQRYAMPLLLVLFALAVPLMAVYVPKFKHALGMIPMMPRGTDSYKQVQKVDDLFGMTAVFPFNLLLVPGKQALSKWTSTNTSICEWNFQICRHLLNISGSDVQLTGSMVINGKCLYTGQDNSSSHPLTAEFLANAYVSPHIPTYISSDFSDISAFKVGVSTRQLNIFAEAGQDWIKQTRDRLTEFVGSDEGKSLLGLDGNIYLTGEACTQLDNSDKAYSFFIPMMGLMFGLVILLLGFTFRSVLLPVRAVICLLWMLGMTFGLAIAVYQYGWFDFMSWDSLSKRQLGGMYWMSPLIAFPIIVGLGLDYDIFYTERVHEEIHNGFSDTQAAVRALGFTANTISAAGLIMVMAFSALLVSSTASMNEISFLLIIGILCDCFVTTKFIIPSSMALMDGFNFWPSKSSNDKSLGSTPEGCKLLCTLSRCCNGGNV